ncbi:peptidoglycan-binding protein [Rothia dentocariosa]|uniref:peptidoglycan-binding protein n=1 Tax=Rothia dentocariosa TaxID=2047 RepID=UPI00287FF57A|nr:peptidoglycan-binding protein [Rothia dentocariosa]
MTAENKGFSRRKLLKAGAIGVPAAGVLAFGSTLVTATSANAISTDGWWGEETSAGFQRFMNAALGANLVVDGWISSQPAAMAPYCPGIVGGWEWAIQIDQGSPTISKMSEWLGMQWKGADGSSYSYPYPHFSSTHVNKLQSHYGIAQDGRLDGPSKTIQALQNEINQWVG